MMNEVRGELFLRRLPPEIRNGLDPAQEAAIRAAASSGSGAHRFDLRFTLPTPWGAWYVVVLAGPERRSAARRQWEAERRPLLSAGANGGSLLRAAFLGVILLAVLLIYGTVGGF